MSNTVKIVKIQDGPSDVVYRVYLKSDGSGELVNQILINPDDLKNQTNNPGGPYVPLGIPAGRCFNVQQVWYNLSPALNVILSFAGTPNNEFMVLASSTDSYIDLRPASGIADNTPDSQIPDGSILISTDGFASANQYGWIVIKVKKMK